MSAAAPPGRTLFLHVGTHKTGTTAIQRVFEKNADALLAGSGIAVWPRRNAFEVANLFVRREIVSNTRLRGWCAVPDIAGFRQETEAFGARIDALEGQAVWISSEEFCLLREAVEFAALAGVLYRHFARVVPILALREESGWRASRRAQMEKRGMWTVQNALPPEHSSNGPWYYDRAAIRAFWDGFDNPVVFDYDAETRQRGSIVPAVLEAVGAPPDLPGNDRWVNRRAEEGGT